MARVVAVARGAKHGITKSRCDAIHLVAGHGVEGDAHYGATVMHRSRRAKFPDMPNLRQVHLIHAALYDEIAAKGFTLPLCSLGENITTQDIDLLNLSCGTNLTFPSGASIELTGLRNPCAQLNGVAFGLMDALIDKAPDGSLIRKGGVMGIVLVGGEVRAGDAIGVETPSDQSGALLPV